jgi:hypothetical protein
VSAPRRKMNNEVSALASTNPKENRYMVNRLYQAQDACFNPYKDLCRQHTKSG